MLRAKRAPSFHSFCHPDPDEPISVLEALATQAEKQQLEKVKVWGLVPGSLITAL